MPAISNAGQVYVANGSLTIQNASGQYVAVANQQKTYAFQVLPVNGTITVSITVDPSMQSLLLYFNILAAVASINVIGVASGSSYLNVAAPTYNPVPLVLPSGLETTFHIVITTTGGFQANMWVIGSQAPIVSAPFNQPGNPLNVAGNVGLVGTPNVGIVGTPTVAVTSEPLPYRLYAHSYLFGTGVNADAIWHNIGGAIAKFNKLSYVDIGYVAYASEGTAVGSYIGQVSFQLLGVTSLKTYRLFDDVATVVLTGNSTTSSSTVNHKPGDFIPTDLTALFAGDTQLQLQAYSDLQGSPNLFTVKVVGGIAWDD